jgi:CheY-like chemotaxis protein
MARETVLVADSDLRNLRLLEMALRRAGFVVIACATGEDALHGLKGAGVQTLICDLALASVDGLALCRAARAKDGVPVLVMGADASAAAKARAIEAGADEYLVKPVLIKELVQRVQHLLDRRRLSDPGAPAGLTGSVRDFGLLDVFHSIDSWKKSAVVRCENGGQLARVWVRDGDVIDAELGPLAGNAAFWRLMTWDRGHFRVDFTSSPREARIQGGTQAALMEAMRRVDEVGRLAQELPLETQLSVDVARLEAVLSEIPDELNGVLRHFDGVRPLRAAIDLSPVDDVATMEAVQRLVRDGILRPGSRSASLEAWVSDPPPAPVVAEPAMPRIVNFPAIRGLRRERLRREAEEARMKIASGEPVRLHHVVELPPRAESEALGELRRISPAAGEAAKRLTADARLARLASVDGELPPIAPVVATTPPPPEAARIAMRFALQRWGWLAGLVVALTIGWVLRPQPRTDRKDSPWLEGTREGAASGAAAPGAYAEAVARGNDSFRQGKFSAAADQYKKALGLRPQAVPVLVALGDAYLESDRPRNAVEPLEAAARLDPASARAQLLLGTAYQSLGRTAEATRAYRRYLELEPASEFAKDVKVILANLGG